MAGTSEMAPPFNTQISIDRGEGERPGLIRYFIDGGFISATPDAQGKGCDISWATDVGPRRTADRLLKVHRLIPVVGALNVLGDNDEYEFITAEGPEILSRIEKAQQSSIGYMQLHTPRMSLNWYSQYPQPAYAQVPHNSIRIGFNGETNERKDLERCIALTALGSVHSNYVEALDGFSLNIPFLRRT